MNKCSQCETLSRTAKIPYRLCNVKTAKGQKYFSATGLRGVPVLKIGD